MEVVFNFIGGIFGYILWSAFYLTKNYGIAIILFTIVIKALLFPFSVKQQKSMAANARMQQKQKEIMDNIKDEQLANLKSSKNALKGATLARYVTTIPDVFTTVLDKVKEELT